MNIQLKDISSLVTDRQSALKCIHDIMYTKNIEESHRTTAICECILSAFPEKRDYLLHYSCIVLATEVDQFYNTNIADEFYNMEV